MLYRSISGIILLAAIVSSASAREISRDNYVDWIGASSASSAEESVAVSSAAGYTKGSHFIQWKNEIHADCQTPAGLSRSRISVEDKALFSLLLAARTAGKKVGFYYETTATTAGVTGHGVS